MSLGNERAPTVGLQEGRNVHDSEGAGHRAQGIEALNMLLGGEHLFMPSLSALRWIGASPSDRGQSRRTNERTEQARPT